MTNKTWMHDGVQVITSDKLDPPKDTIQSRMPEPGWLEHWLDKQIQFDKHWEGKVSGRILHNMSILLKQPFNSVQDLNKFRKSLSSGSSLNSTSA